MHVSDITSLMHDREGGRGGEGEREEERGEEGGRGGGRRRGKRRGKRRGNIYVHVDTIKQRSSVLAAVVTIPLQPALNVYPLQIYGTHAVPQPKSPCWYPNPCEHMIGLLTLLG